MIETSLWHEAAVQDLTALLQADPDVLALAVFGSYLQPQILLDIWSDLDVVLVVKAEALERFYPTVDWLTPLGTVYAYEQSSNAFRHTTRLCFEDLRRIDLVIATESGLHRVEDWSRLPFWKNIKILFSRSAQIDRILSETFEQPKLSLPSPERFQTMANRFWFKAVAAVHKVARNDLLIALHLAVDMVRDCCVLGMMLRDRAEGTNYHRDGGIGNRFAAKLESSIQQPPTASGILNMIEESSAVFDDLAAQWSDVYRESRHPLLTWIRQARETLLQ